MDFDALDLCAQKLMKRRKAHPEREIGSVYFHGVRVSRLVLALRREVLPEEESMDDVLRLAALFHDVGKGVEPHARYGAAIFLTAMEDHPDVSPAQTRAAARMIAEHCDRHPENPTCDVWSRLLQDADLLDHIGTYKVWMDFNYAAWREEGIETACARMEEDMVPRYIVQYRSLLNFPQSVAHYDKKCEFLRAFAARLSAESRGQFFD